jgi:hypothetical protein
MKISLRSVCSVKNTKVSAGCLLTLFFFEEIVIVYMAYIIRLIMKILKIVAMENRFTFFN